MRARKYDHVTPLLKELHWLPITARIQYKIASLVFKCQHDDDFPLYIKQLLLVTNQLDHYDHHQRIC